MKALLIVCLLGWAVTARAQCVQATCMAMDKASACLTQTWQCELVDPTTGTTACLPISTNEPPLGTACETDGNDCTTDACGGTAGMTTGDGVCHHTAIPDGTMCGGGHGTCTSGTCSCATGYKICNGTCITNDACCVDNDCLTLAKCLDGATCVQNQCMGTQKTCAASGSCRVAACDPSSGACAETIAPAGSSCSLGLCLPNATCDSSGTCVGDPAPDGTPCNSACGATTCQSGVCACDADGGTEPTDASASVAPKSHGCDATPGLPSSAIGLFALAIVATILQRRIVKR